MLADGCLYSLPGERFQFHTEGTVKGICWLSEGKLLEVRPVNAIVKKKWIHLKIVPLRKKGINYEKFHSHKSVENTNYTML